MGIGLKLFIIFVPGVCRLVTRPMLYSFLEDRTQVDSDLIELQKKQKIKLFKFRSKDSNYVMFMSDYINYVTKHLKDLNIPGLKVITALKEHNETESFPKSGLKGIFCLSDNAIDKLVHSGLLSVSSSQGFSTYQFSLPCAGKFVDLLNRGKTQILKTLRQKSSQEILEHELSTMPLKHCSLGTKYILLDLIGSNKIQSIKCGMGQLIRLVR